MAKFATNASGAMLLPNLIQVMESISGSVVPLAMFNMLDMNVPIFYTLDMIDRNDNSIKMGEYLVTKGVGARGAV